MKNSLADFWCLMDTAQPGLLGSWPEFRGAYVQPINKVTGEEQHDVRIQVGHKLRQDVGCFMLAPTQGRQSQGASGQAYLYRSAGRSSARIGLMNQPIASQMQADQLAKYDEAIKSYNFDRESGQGKGLALAVLMKLREISLHPCLNDDQRLLSSSAKEALAALDSSAKLENLVALLQEIRQRQEKVIIFAITKKLQRYLKIWFEQIFALKIHIINGDTKAVSSKKNVLTRKGIIDSFENQPGFGIIIMSPVAAGVGLTVVGANNVVHLERHWNPAKEAQATDRVYRIGQQKEVNIYLPALHHPRLTSFDVNLDRLLQKKMTLKDAVVTPQAVTADELESLFG